MLRYRLYAGNGPALPWEEVTDPYDFKGSNTSDKALGQIARANISQGIWTWFFIQDCVDGAIKDQGVAE